MPAGLVSAKRLCRPGSGLQLMPAGQWSTANAGRAVMHPVPAGRLCTQYRQGGVATSAGQGGVDTCYTAWRSRPVLYRMAELDPALPLVRHGGARPCITASTASTALDPILLTPRTSPYYRATVLTTLTTGPTGPMYTCHSAVKAFSASLQQLHLAVTLGHLEVA